jgi:hypothetical protein
MSAGSSCPSADLVHDVLDRTALDDDASRVRAHVARCDRCVEQFGALFELELWSPALAPPTVELATARSRGLAKLAAAAAIVVAVALGAALVRSRLASHAPHPSRDAVAAVPSSVPSRRALRVEVVELVTTTSESGPDGTHTRTVRRDGDRPGLLLCRDESRARDGLTRTHERVEPLVAAR